jgi:hypothetical protein
MNPLHHVAAKRASASEIWSGETFGRKTLVALIAQCAEFQGRLCVVDMTGISLVTASAFRAALRGLKEYVATTFGVPTIFVNATSETLEEAEYVATKFGEIYVFGQLEGDRLHNVQLVGQLDEPLRSTLALVEDLGESDARALFQHAGSPGIGAWHNRLSDLVARGLLISRAEGRSKTYRAISKEFLHGT